jgi:hypothetical protein
VYFHIFFILAAEAPKPDVPVSETSQNTHGEPPLPKANIPPNSSLVGIRSASKNTADETNTRSWMFKPTLNVAEKRESRSSKDSSRRRQKREEVVFKKRELAERQAAEADKAIEAAEAAEAAAHESQQDTTAGAPVIPEDDADLNNRIEEIEYDMQKTFQEFENI